MKGQSISRLLSYLCFINTHFRFKFNLCKDLAKIFYTGLNLLVTSFGYK